MSLEDFSPIESSEGGSQSAEISEKYKEQSKKASRGIKRTKKDEKKAKKYDFLLARFLVEMILKKKYDTLLDELFSCLDAGYGSNFLLGIMSLVYMPISATIRENIGKNPLTFLYEATGERINFDDHALPDEIRNRVNAWIEDMETILVHESSVIISQRTLSMVLYDEKIRLFASQVFSHFFNELNIEISEEKSLNYSNFILGELEKSLKKHMPEMRQEWTQEGLEI